MDAGCFRRCCCRCRCRCLCVQTHVKITDFGLSKDSEQHSQPKTKRVGTISYMAPEVAMASGEMPYSGTPALHCTAPRQSGSVREIFSMWLVLSEWREVRPVHLVDAWLCRVVAAAVCDVAGEGADVWSLGIILYVLVCCEYPFGFDGVGGQPTQRVLARIKEGAFSFPTDKVPLSPEIMSLITGILNVDLDARLTIAGIMAHPWYTAGDEYAPDAGVTVDRSIAWDLAPQLPNVPSIESVEFEFDSDDGE